MESKEKSLFRVLSADLFLEFLANIFIAKQKPVKSTSTSIAPPSMAHQGRDQFGGMHMGHLSYKQYFGLFMPLLVW